MYKSIKNIENEKIAKKIVDFLKEHECWQDIIIYFNNKAWSTFKNWKKEQGKEVMKEVYEYQDKNPRDFFEYVNSEHRLSMSFEGPFYYIMNGYMGQHSYKIQDEFQNLFDEFGLYCELGDAWNLSLYK